MKLSEFFDLKIAGDDIPVNLDFIAKKKIINMPFASAGNSAFAWTVGMGIMVGYSGLFYNSKNLTAWLYDIISVLLGLLLTGICVSVIVYFHSEGVCRNIRPHIFKDGLLAGYVGGRSLRLSRKLFITFIITSFMPILLFAAILLEQTEIIGASSGMVFEKMYYLIAFLTLVTLSVTFTLTKLFAESLVEPVEKLERVMASVENGELDVKATVESNDELGRLAESFNSMIDGLRDRERIKHEYNQRLEVQVRERTAELRGANDALVEKNIIIEEYNKGLRDSIQYAKMIQESLLPNLSLMNDEVPESFYLWIPKDVVGGDIYFIAETKKGLIVAVIDCTGHGVPGAFMTMIASTALRRVVIKEGISQPAGILRRLNSIVKRTLQQDTDYGVSNDGMDAAICLIRTKKKKLVFAGARLPLTIADADGIRQIKGDRQSIGYRESDLAYRFTDHEIVLEKKTCIYMATDGYTDQLGGKKNFSFGRKKFKNLISRIWENPMEQQKDELMTVFNEYKHNNERQDDITVLGFSC